MLEGTIEAAWLNIPSHKTKHVMGNIPSSQPKADCSNYSAYLLQFMLI